MAQLIPAGWYIGTVVDHRYGPEEGRPGSPYLQVQFQLEVMPPAQGASPGTISAYLYLTDAALEYTGRRIRDIGYTGSDAEALGDGSAMRGMRARVQVIHEEYQGKVRAKVGFIDPEFGLRSGGHPEAPRDKARRLSALLATIPTNNAPAEDEIPL